MGVDLDGFEPFCIEGPESDGVLYGIPGMPECGGRFDG